MRLHLILLDGKRIMEHWTEEFTLYEALIVGDLSGYEVEPEVETKADYIISLACYLIKNPFSTLATGYDMVCSFINRARAAVS